jgi:hypothetical protein
MVQQSRQASPFPFPDSPLCGSIGFARRAGNPSPHRPLYYVEWRPLYYVEGGDGGKTRGGGSLPVPHPLSGVWGNGTGVGDAIPPKEGRLVCVKRLLCRHALLGRSRGEALVPFAGGGDFSASTPSKGTSSPRAQRATGGGGNGSGVGLIGESTSAPKGKGCIFVQRAEPTGGGRNTALGSVRRTPACSGIGRNLQYSGGGASYLRPTEVAIFILLYSVHGCDGIGLHPVLRILGL